MSSEGPSSEWRRDAWAGSSGLALLEAILLLGHIQFKNWWIGAAGMEVSHERWTRRGETRLSGVSDGVGATGWVGSNCSHLQADITKTVAA